MRRFDYHRPASLAEAVSLLREHGDGGRILAGGTDLLVQIKEGHRRPEYLLSLSGIAELEELRFSGDRGLRIGARVLMQELADDETVRERFTALAEGAEIIGSYQTRNMATVGGNVCNAAPSADISPPLSVLGATVHIVGEAGERDTPIDELWTGPGQTVLQATEIVSHFSVPLPPPGAGSSYERHTPRQEMDIAAVAAGAYVEVDGAGVCTAARIALGAVAPTVIRAPGAEAALVGGEITADRAAEAGGVAAGEATPISDQRGSAEFRRHLVEVITTRTILRAAERARG